MIVCLGDSTTAGTPLFKSPVEAPPDGEGDVRSQFAYWLLQAHPAWRVLNRGVNGERSDEIAARFDRDVLAHRPQVVVIIAGVNDVYQGRNVSHVTAQLAGMYARVRAAGAALVAGTIVPYNTATQDQNARMRAINELDCDTAANTARDGVSPTRARRWPIRRTPTACDRRQTSCIRTSTAIAAWPMPWARQSNACCRLADRRLVPSRLRLARRDPAVDVSIVAASLTAFYSRRVTC